MYSITNRQEAKRVVIQLISQKFLLPCEKIKGKQLTAIPFRDFNEEGYYIWLYEDPMTQKIAMLKGFLLVFGVLLVVLFPMWPYQLRVGAWYLSMGGLVLFGVLLAIMIIRFPIFWISRLIRPPGIWLFPNINEDVGVIESFKPVWDWDKPVIKKKDKKGAKDEEEDDEKDSGKESGRDSEKDKLRESDRDSEGSESKVEENLLKKRILESESKLESENDGDTENPVQRKGKPKKE